MKNGGSVKELKKKYKNIENNENVIKKTLLKKASGFVLEEITEEYASEENENLKLLKRKITTKEVAPDINAIKVLIELKDFNKTDYSNLTDEELNEEKNRLLKLLEGLDEND